MVCYKLCPMYDYDSDKCGITGRHPHFMKKCANTEIARKLIEQEKGEGNDGSGIYHGYADRRAGGSAGSESSIRGRESQK